MQLSEIIKNTGWIVSGRVFGLVINIFVLSLLTRYLGPEQFGLLSYSMALVSLFAVIATLGLNRIVTRELVTHPEKKPQILGTVVSMRVIAGILLSIAVYFVSLYFSVDREIVPLLALVIAMSMVFQAFDVIDLWHQSIVRSKYTVIAKFVTLVLSSGIKIFLIVNEYPLVYFAWAILVESILNALALIIAHIKTDNHFRSWSPKLEKAKSFLLESWPEIIAGFSTLIFMKMDQIMLGHMLDTHAVGVYAAASRISEAWYIIPIAITASAFPALIKAKSTSEDSYHGRLRQQFQSLTVLSYGLIIFILLTSSFLVSLLYGDNYKGSADVLNIHAWTAITVSIGLVSGSWIYAEKRAKLSLYRSGIGALSNLLLNYFLIKNYGLLGAAYATLISQIIAFYLFDLLTPSMRGIFVAKTRALLLIDIKILVPKKYFSYLNSLIRRK